MNSTKEFYRKNREKIIDLLRAGEMPMEEIAVKVGVAASTVTRIARQNGLRRKDIQVKPEENDLRNGIEDIP